MSTTAVIVEHLIAGLHALLWIFILVITFAGYHWIDLSAVKDFAALLTFLVLAAAYPIGVFIDEAADFVFDNASMKMRDACFDEYGLDKSDDKLTAFVLLQISSNEFLRSYLNYIRMRIRISRSAAINFLLLTIALLAFTINNGQPSWRILFIELSLGLALTALSFWSWQRVSRLFAKQVSRAYNALQHSG